MHPLPKEVRIVHLFIVRVYVLSCVRGLRYPAIGEALPRFASYVPRAHTSRPDTSGGSDMSREHRGEDAGERVTRDDERARRVAGLLMSFSGSRRPLTSGEIRNAYYPELSSESFRRAFSRDREVLAQCGMVIQNVAQSGEDASWVVDERLSFVQPSELLPEEALTLDVACAPLVTDPDFPYRSDLRLALAKLDRHFGSATPVFVGEGAGGGGTVARELMECLAARIAVRVTYVDAMGRETKRVLAPYGSFGLRGNTYLVAASKASKGSGWGEAHTFRLDRFKSARRIEGRSYQVPGDFCLRDFLKLPFQAGPIIATCSFSFPTPPNQELREQLEGRGTWEDDAPERTVWTAGVSDLGLASSWAVAAGAIPIGPNTLVDQWRTLLEDALASARDASSCLDVLPSQHQLPSAASLKRRAARMGRKGGIDEARELAALLGALTREGDQVSAASVAARLGCGIAHARHLLMLVATSWDEEELNLPLMYGEDDDTLTLAFDGGVKGRPLRLSLSETYALLAALDSIGVGDGDPIVTQLRESIGAVGQLSPRSKELERAMSTEASNETYETCVRAIANRMWLSFSYTASPDSPSTRKVAPRGLRSSEGQWYLDGFDIVRRGERTFRLDRMREPRCVKPKQQSAIQSPNTHGDAKRVVVRFASESLAYSRSWNDLAILSRDEDGGVTTSLPWYGGQWLVRNLASCGSNVTVGDDRLREAIASYCDALLGQER